MLTQESSGSLFSHILGFGPLAKLLLLHFGESDLTLVHQMCILMHMRSTLNIDDEMLRKAAALTGEKEKTALVRMGLEALIARESARRLARLGGTEPHLSPIRRRRQRSTQ